MRKRNDEGAGTLLTFVMFPILFLALAIVWAFIDISTVRQQAAGAADLAALAGAPFVLMAPEDACTRAATIARENRGELVECTTDGLDIVVTVAVSSRGIASRLAGWLGVTLPPVRETARAGPG